MAFKTVKPNVQKYKVQEPVENEDYGAEVTKHEVRALKALEYALAGKSPKEIGPLLDPPTNAAGVRAILRTEIADRKEDLTESLREKEIMRLDKQRNYLWDRAFGYEDVESGKWIQGEPKYHRMLLEVDDAFRKLTGLNAAQEVRISDAVEDVLEVVKNVLSSHPALYQQVLTRLAEEDSSGAIRTAQPGATGLSSSGSLLN